MKNFFQKNKGAYFFILLSLLFFLFAIVFYYGSDNYSGDGLRHYIVSRWCWKHPDLLLYHWGKPFFTLITSPFSQLGHKGIQLFNLVVSSGGAWLLYRFAKEKQIANSSLIILFAFFATGFFEVINTGLTEPLFFFMTAASAYLLYKEKYAWSCLLLSFLPYVRSEGNMIIILFILVLAWERKWKYIPLLLAGTVIYSIIGGLYYRDFLWIWTRNPYDGTNRDFYGSGELIHFLKNYKHVLGTPLSLAFLFGIIFYIKEVVKKGIKEFLNHYAIEAVILTGSFIVYFTAHSIFWWKGLYNSLGLTRAIAGVVPVATICCLRGLNLIVMLLKNNLLKQVLVIAFALIVIAFPFLINKFPFKLDAEDKVTQKAIDWFKSSPYKDELVFYLNPYFADNLDRDPYDDKQMRELWGLLPSIREWGYNAFPDSTIIFWDAHFGPNECRVPLDSMKLNPHFELLNTFKPEVSFQTLGGYDYQILAFVKIPIHELTAVDSVLYDFEKTDALSNTETINGNKFLSGNKSCFLNPEKEFSATVIRSLDEFSQNKKLRGLKISFSTFSEHPLTGSKLVFSATDQDGKDIEWQGKDVLLNDNELNKWSSREFSFRFNTDSYQNKNMKFKIYLWNSARETFWIDDLKIVFLN